MEAFRSAPREVRERAAVSSLLVTLKIAQIEEFMDHDDIAKLRHEKKTAGWVYIYRVCQALLTDVD